MIAATLTRLQNRMESIKNGNESVYPGKPQTLSAAASPNDAVHQGDLTFVVIDAVPKDYARPTKPYRQLAKGNSRGSRHMIADLAGVEQWLPPGWESENYLRLDGPVLVIKQRTEIVHADGQGHGTITLEPGLIVSCRYAQTLDYATKLGRRQMD